MRASRYWHCQLVGWSAYALGVTAPYVAKGTDAPGRLFAYSIALAALGLGQTHLLRGWARRRGWPKLDVWHLAPRVLVSSALMGAVMNLFMSVADVYWFHVDTWATLAVVWQVVSWLWWFFPVFVGWQAIYFAVQFVRRARKAERETWQLATEAQAAELRFLKAQLNPHFLFNALNSLRALIAEDAARAQVMVTQLSALMRHSLASAQGTVPLERELEVVNDYLALESIRLEERLRVRLDIEPDSLPCRVPPMLLQGLVENGIKHGIALLPRGGELSIAAKIDGATLDLLVTSPSAPTRAPSEGGVGLVNARERLRLLFGAGAVLALEVGAHSSTAHVLIPQTVE